jgi:phosphomannomutase/phosphoglucomutase
MTSHIFREYDIRGVADRDLTPDIARGVGRGLATLLGSPPGGAPLRIAVGRDCRVSGPRIVENVVSGLTQAGAHVIDVGEGPTPMLYFAVNHLGADGGIMVTGSHNPGDENGFKMMKGKGSFFGEDIQKLRRVIENGDYAPERAGTVEKKSVEDAYVELLAGSIKLADPTMKVVIDAGNGAAGPLALRTLRALGVDPVALFCDMDGTFPNHHPDPTVPKNLETLIETVKREKARIGIAFDGDGDRLGVVDASGEIIWGDRLLALFARDMLKSKPGAAVIGEVKCSQSLFDDVAKHGGRPIMWKTGHSLIKTKMKEEKALLAGEMSGHFFFADRYFGYDDGIYAAARILEIVSREKRSVSELLSDLPRSFSTPEIRADCADSVKGKVVATVREHFASRYETTAIDGVRIKYADGAWALVRASNTGPIIVLRFEAPTEARLAEIRAEVESFLDATRANLA